MAFFFINIIPTGTSLLLCICDSDRAATIIYVLRSLKKCDFTPVFYIFYSVRHAKEDGKICLYFDYVFSVEM